MSFTLVRYKDGKEIPIKVSILDAFRSAPPRRPKAVQPEKKTETPPSLVKTSNSPRPTNDSDAAKDTSNAKNHSDHEEETYTAEDDAKIIEMKAVPGTSWNAIKEAIGKQSASQLKEHYKLHLGPNAEVEQKKATERAAKAEKNKTEGLAKQTEECGKKAAEEDGKKAAEEGEKKAAEEGEKKAAEEGEKKAVEEGEKKAVEEDEKKAAEEASGGGGGNGGGGGGRGGKKKKKGRACEVAANAQDGKNKGKENANANAKEESKKDEATPATLTKENLQTFVKKYERDKWLAAASRHYDLTGQRISPEAAKKMADQK